MRRVVWLMVMVFGEISDSSFHFVPFRMTCGCHADPLAQERPWLSPYNYCQWNPVGRVDPSGALDNYWHPDGRGNLVADRGDNQFTLQNYIWRTTGSTINVKQARSLIHTMYNGNPISDFTGKRINYIDIKNIAGGHIASMINPGTALVHKGQNDFFNSEPVQLPMTVLSLALPAGSILKTFKSLSVATPAMATKEALAFFLRDMPTLMIALDNVMGAIEIAAHCHVHYWRTLDIRMLQLLLKPDLVLKVLLRALRMDLILF